MFDKEYSSMDDIYRVLSNEYPGYKILKYPNWEKDCHKYEWQSFMVFEYNGNKYLSDLTAIGNGGWLGLDTYRITNVLKIKNTYVEKVDVVKYEFWMIGYLCGDNLYYDLSDVKGESYIKVDVSEIDFTFMLSNNINRNHIKKFIELKLDSEYYKYLCANGTIDNLLDNLENIKDSVNKYANYLLTNKLNEINKVVILKEIKDDVSI